MSKTLTIKATELTDVNMTRVALVKRGANRIPFRIIKEDKPMGGIDFQKIGRALFRKSDPVPAVAAVVLNKAGNVDGTMAALAKADIVLKRDADDGDVVVFGRNDVVATLVKLDDDTILSVEHVQKGLHEADLTGSVYDDLVKGEGAFPGVVSAMEVFERTVLHTLAKADDAATTGERIAKACDDFRAYCTLLATHLPATVLKADAMLKADKTMAGKWTGTEDDMDGKDSEKDGDKDCVQKTGDAACQPLHDDNEESMQEAQRDGAAVVKGEVISAKPTHGNETQPFKTAPAKNNIDGDPVVDNGKGDTDTSLGEKSPSNDIENNSVVDKQRAEMASMLKDMADTIQNSFAAAIADLRKDMGDLSTRVDHAATLARKAEEAVHGTVSAEPAGDRASVKKGEASSAPPLLDTGYSRRIA